jgi:serine/threonine-protein kinase RsbW
MPSGTRGVFCRCFDRSEAISRTFPGRSDQVSASRQFVREALADLPSAADAVLLTSELAANAVLHTDSGGSGRFAVAVRHVPALVHVEVTDGGLPAVPTVNPRGRLGPSGRGLVLVDQLATRWGHKGGPPGRIVWFELDCP